MYRSLFSVAAAFSLLLSTIISPAGAYARRCPVEPPNTLLSLYRKSDAVYLGKFDKRIDGSVVRQDEDSSTIKVNENFSITTTFKGETRKFFERSYDDYRYQGNTGNGSEPEIDEEDYEGSRKLKVGDTVLLFLKYDEEQEAADDGKRDLDVVHYRDGIKRLNPEDVAAYEARINDLKGILSSGQQNDAAILQWILRCIEDPSTRWEGAYELLESFQNLEWKDQQEKDAGENPQAVDPENKDQASVDEQSNEPDAEAEIDGTDEEEGFDNSVYSKLLTDAQKDQLTNIAIASGQNSSNTGNDDAKSEELSNGDRILFELVKRWGDTKIASVMLDRLRITSENYDRLSWMNSIAEILKDKELTSISEKFSDVTYQEDDAEVEARSDEPQDSADTKPATAEGETEEPAKAVDPEPAKGETSAASSDEKPIKKTYKMLRDELISQFIERASLVLTLQDKKGGAK